MYDNVSRDYTPLTYFPQYPLHRLQEKTVVCVCLSMFVCMTLMQFSEVLCKKIQSGFGNFSTLMSATTQLTDMVIRREGVHLCMLREAVWLCEQQIMIFACVFMSIDMSAKSISATNDDFMRGTGCVCVCEQ